jgi:hypothetical protein
MIRRRLLPFLALWVGLVMAPGLSRGASLPRVAVVVGSNGAAPGRQPLLFGHRDADEMAGVLHAVGGFAAADVHVLKDPAPEALLAALEGGLSRLGGRPESLLFFYYSGHADDESLYPGGRALPMARIRAVIDHAGVSVRIGVVDACRGGSWTRAKGLRPERPFPVRWPLGLGNEGSVLIASSSGTEAAHESEHLQGSFFTRHFTAGLRGGADRNGNGQVTLSEAFEYAQERTIRDTTRLAPEIQHPSYSVNLRGRRDLVLAEVDASPSRLRVAQAEGPLEVIHADTGLLLLELPPGPRRVRLAVPPGRYVIRKAVPAGHLIKEISVLAGASDAVDEGQLVLVASPQLVAKHIAPVGEPAGRASEAAPAAVTAGRWLLMPAVGSGFGWVQGRPEMSPSVAVSDGSTTVQPIEFEGLATARLFHFAPEVAYRWRPQLLVSAQLRLQVVTGATELRLASCTTTGVCRPPRTAFAALARAGWLTRPTPPGAVWLSFAVGAGQLRYLVDLSNFHSTCGPQRNLGCRDTVAAGPLLLGPGVTYFHQLGRRTSLYLGATALGALPRRALNLDGAVGVAIGL